MDVTGQLENVRQDIGRCTVVALVDLGTRMVLASASNGRVPREDLDRLAELAEEVLTGEVAENALGQGDGASSTTAYQAVVSTAEETRLCLRSQDAPNEALVCVCGPDVSLAHARDCGLSALAVIVAGQ